MISFSDHLTSFRRRDLRKLWVFRRVRAFTLSSARRVVSCMSDGHSEGVEVYSSASITICTDSHLLRRNILSLLRTVTFVEDINSATLLYKRTKNERFLRHSRLASYAQNTWVWERKPDRDGTQSISNHPDQERGST